MKTFFKNLKGGLTFGLGFLVMLFIGGFVFASLSNVEEGDTLTAQKWNEIIGEIETLKNQNLTLNSAIPQGATIAFNSSICPSGWLPADGTNGTIDLRGVFIRGANSFDNGVTYNNRDEDRAIAGSGVLTYQDDQIIPITGSSRILIPGSTHIAVENTSGALRSNSAKERIAAGLNYSSNQYSTINLILDTAILGINYSGSDTHPKNIALIYCIKA